MAHRCRRFTVHAKLRRRVNNGRAHISQEEQRIREDRDAPRAVRAVVHLKVDVVQTSRRIE